MKIEENNQRASRAMSYRCPLQPALKNRPKFRSNRLLNVTLWTTVNNDFDLDDSASAIDLDNM